MWEYPPQIVRVIHVMAPTLSKGEYRAIFESSPDGVLVVGLDGNIRRCNRQIEALFGWSPSDLLGQSIDVLVPDHVRGGHGELRAGFARHAHARPMGVGLDLEGQRRDGSRFPVEISLSPLDVEDGKGGVVCSVRDVSERRRLQNFSEGALRATEEERQRIARELHDDTAQRLATLILRVRVLAGEESPTRRRELLGEIREEIVEASDGVKRLSRGLRPPELEEVGLVLALQAHLRSLREGTGFDVEFVADEVENLLGITAKLVVYRIVQESLSNSMRHAGVHRARVVILSTPDGVTVEIGDDGRGFLLTGLSGDGRGLGLVGMSERAAMIDGRLTIDSSPGEGTRIRLTVPVEETPNG